MGKIPNGITGPVHGRIGNLIGSTWKGIPYLKLAPKPRTKNVSEKELANRQKFAMAQAWLAPILDFVREGFKGYSQYSEGFVAAKSYLLKNAVEGQMFDIRINPELVKVSSGDLPLPAQISVQKTGSRFQFTWNSSSEEVGADPNDQVMALFYNIEKGKCSLATAGQFRWAGSYEYPVSFDEPGNTYHIYFAMVAVDRSRRSDSVYLGAITT